MCMWLWLWLWLWLWQTLWLSMLVVDMHVDVCDVVVVVLVVVAVMVVILRTQYESLVIQRVIFRAFQPLTTVDVKRRTIFQKNNIKNNSPKLSAAGPAGDKNLS